MVDRIDYCIRQPVPISNTNRQSIQRQLRLLLHQKTDASDIWTRTEHILSPNAMNFLIDEAPHRGAYCRHSW